LKNDIFVKIIVGDKILTKSTMKILKYLESIVLDINNEIENINLEIKNHELKLFYKFRKSNCNIMIKNLINHIKILDERFDLLIKLINI
jgi:hypothetical protein